MVDSVSKTVLKISSYSYHMVSYEAFEDWAKDTFETKNGDLIVYQDTMMFNVPFEAEHAETTMSVEDLYQMATAWISAYDTVEQLRLNDFEDSLSEVYLDYWEEQGYLTWEK